MPLECSFRNYSLVGLWSSLGWPQTLEWSPAFPCTEDYPVIYQLSCMTYKISLMLKTGINGSNSFFFFSKSAAIKITILFPVRQIHIKDEKRYITWIWMDLFSNNRNLGNNHTLRPYNDYWQELDWWKSRQLGKCWLNKCTEKPWVPTQNSGRKLSLPSLRRPNSGIMQV